MARLVGVGASGPQGMGAYWSVLTNQNYLTSLIYTFVLSALVTFATLIISCIAGLVPAAQPLSRPQACSWPCLPFRWPFPAWWWDFLNHPAVRRPGHDRRNQQMAHRRKTGAAYRWPACFSATCISRFRASSSP